MSNLETPQSWVKPKLEELLLVTIGGDWGKAPDFVDADFVEALCIRGSEFRHWTKDKGSTASLRKIKVASLEKRKLQNGDVLVEVSGGGPEQPVGRTVLIDRICLAHQPETPKVPTNFLRLARPSGLLSSTYLNSFLTFFYSAGGTVEYQGGSNNLRNLKFPDYITIKIPLPPLNEQKRIVAKIEELFSELDAGVASLKQARTQLGTYRQSLLKQAFEGKLTAQWRRDHPDQLESPEKLLTRIQQERETRYQQSLQTWQTAIEAWEAGDDKGPKPAKPRKPKPSEEISQSELKPLTSLPKHWLYARLGESIVGIDAGKSFSCDERRPSQDKIGVAKVSAVTWGKYDEAESKTCRDVAKVNPNYFINDGDFILSRANTIDLVGAAVIVRRTTQKIMLSDKTLRIRFAGVSQEYVLQYLRSRIGRLQIMSRSTGNQESMRNIGQDRISAIVTPLCSLPEQQEIVRLLEEQFTAIEQNEREIEASLHRAEALRQSILKRAFSGQLVPQDPSDEPAPQLLARIQAERAKSEKVTPTKKAAKKARKTKRKTS